MRFHLKADQLPNYSDFEDLSPSYDTAKAQAELDALTEDEKGKLAAGVAVAVGNEQALPYLGDAANAAANAVRNIDEMFVSLRANLVSLGVDTERFLQDFDAIKTSFRGVVYDSQQLAIKIAQYGESFDSVVVKFCADSSLSVERRIQKIEQFIAESDGFKKDAESMRDRFDNLKDNFSGFVGSFSSWAQDQEKLDNERIQKLYKEIDDLNEEIGKLDSAIYALGAGLAATLPITGIVSVAFPPFAPIIMAVGCVLAGLELTSMVGLLVAKNSLLNQKRGKENEIKRLQNEITKIQATRTQLEKSGMEDLAIFTTNVTVLSQVWINVINDAAKIRGWLEDGAKDADIPEYMKLSLDEGAAVYKNMAHYLENYANGVAIQKLMGGKLGKRI